MIKAAPPIDPKVEELAQLADLSQALRWLRTLINSPHVSWDPDQRATASHDELVASQALRALTIKANERQH